jgi:tRNA threonylcarbamoyladenosine dehydratase
MSDYPSRFNGVARLYTHAGLERLRRSHVCVVGIGGVGSWAVEALARSGVGALTLVDMDDVCLSNVNRQVPAIEGEIGRSKVEAMARRAALINPEIQIRPVAEYFMESTAASILEGPFNWLIDAIDTVSNKVLLIAAAHARGKTIVSTGAAGGRRDPTRIQLADLSEVHNDRLLQVVRKRLRQNHGFARGTGGPLGVCCVFSPEPAVRPGLDSRACAASEDGSPRHSNCETGYGSAAFVTGGFGFAAAAEIIRRIVAD